MTFDKVVFYSLLVPMYLVGRIFSQVFFGSGTAAYYVSFVAWLLANTFILYKFCRKDGSILLIRVITYFFFQCALLAVGLLYFG
jgi:hypothetical protein